MTALKLADFMLSTIDIVKKSMYTNINLRRDRKHSLKFCMETQGYAQAQDTEEVHILRCVLLT